MLEWLCLDCSFNEQEALKVFQEQGIRDPLALSVVMASVKQESKFIPNICEGGDIVDYKDCHRGGYGLIQWTTQSRYDGLGNFCKRYDCNPSSLKGQLRYLVEEVQWKSVLPTLKTSGGSFSTYYNATYRWLGWGVAGPRTQYAYNYLDRLSKNDNFSNIESCPQEIQTPSGDETESMGFFEKLLRFVRGQGQFLRQCLQTSKQVCSIL